MSKSGALAERIAPVHLNIQRPGPVGLRDGDPDEFAMPKFGVDPQRLARLKVDPDLKKQAGVCGDLFVHV